jgi:hypothetical protein
MILLVLLDSNRDMLASFGYSYDASLGSDASVALSSGFILPIPCE